MVDVISINILDCGMLVWLCIIRVITMRKEDEQAIKRALAILKVECQEHKSCKSCRFYGKAQDATYTPNDCVLNSPPMYYNIDAIIKCFT